MKTSRTRKILGWIGLYALWIFMTLVTLLPIYWMFIVSSRSRVQLFDKPTLWLNGFFAANYTTPLSNPVFQRYLTNSLIISTANAILVTVLALFATYALSRWRLQGSDNIFFWTITNRMGPPAAFLLPLFLIFTQVFRIGGYSLFDTHAGLILVNCLFNLPFAIWLMKGIMDGIPIELDEAGLVDGAGRWTVLLRIVTPLVAPGLAITFILSWIFSWNEYLFAATLTSVQARTITTGLAEFVSVTGTNWGEMAAVAIVAIMPALVFLIFVQKYIVTGLTFGAVKE
ncbi:MAG: carbohydrate ABC transporter permease [Anaerolineales bacterium]|nr:carbohydrate ABC transporter permease [Anaerolineales bacterium]